MNRVIAVLIVLALLATGCSYFRSSSGPSDQRARSESLNAAYYTFPDIPVPKEMSLVRDRSLIYETPGLKVGVLLLSGNVDPGSLEEYFKASMPKNGWRFVNSYKYGDIALNFVKDNRACNIRIARVSFTTQAEIWVGPTQEKGNQQGQRGDGIR